MEPEFPKANSSNMFSTEGVKYVVLFLCLRKCKECNELKVTEESEKRDGNRKMIQESIYRYLRMPEDFKAYLKTFAPPDRLQTKRTAQ